MNERVRHEATLQTDTFPAYETVGKEFKAHEKVDHGSGEYVNGNAYINTIEGYFSKLKRSLSGTFHHVSEKHQDRYLAEFDYPFTINNRMQNVGKQTNKQKKVREVLQVTGRDRQGNLWSGDIMIEKYTSKEPVDGISF